MASETIKIYAPASSQYYYELNVEVYENPQTEEQKKDNYSTINMFARLKSVGINFSGTEQQDLSLFWHDDNENQKGILIKSQKITNIGFNSTIELSAYNLRANHNPDGTLKGFATAKFTKKGSSSYVPETNEVYSGWLYFVTIPRYAKITGYNLANPKATQFEVQWSTDKGVDEVQYNLDETGWKVAPGSGTSGNFNITGLKPNTEYSVIIKVKAEDSQLWTNSSAETINTSKAIMYLGTKRVKAYYGKGGKWREAVPYYGKNGKWRAGK